VSKKIRQFILVISDNSCGLEAMGVEGGNEGMVSCIHIQK